MIMKFTQQMLGISIIIVFNVSTPVAFVGPSLLYTGSYSPPITTDWTNFETHYAISSFLVDFSSFSGISFFSISINVLKLDREVVLNFTNNTDNSQLQITNSSNLTILEGGSLFFTSYGMEAKTSEILLSIEGISASGNVSLLDSAFLRFGQPPDQRLRFSTPIAEEYSDNSLFINVYMNILSKNGSGNVYIGEPYANFFGDAFTRPKVEISSPGNYSTTLKTNWMSIPFSNVDTFSSLFSLSYDDYSNTTWDIQGKFKVEITSFETYEYGLASLLSDLYILDIVLLDIVFVTFFSTKFLLRKLNILKS